MWLPGRRMINKVRYRLAGPGDAEAIGVQGRTAFLEAFREEYAPGDIDGYFAATYGTHLQESEIADPAIKILLAEDDRGLLGHLKLGRCSLPVISNRPAAEVKRFYVLRRGQGTDIAHTLLMHGIRTAREQAVKSIALSCWTRNERALRFYLREGFTIAGRQNFRVGSRIDDDYVMERLT